MRIIKLLTLHADVQFNNSVDYLDFYEVIVDEGKARINYHHLIQKSRASNLIVLVESDSKHKILHKNIEKRKLEATFLKKIRQENDCFATRYLSRNRWRVEYPCNQVAAFAIVY